MHRNQITQKINISFLIGLNFIRSPAIQINPTFECVVPSQQLWAKFEHISNKGLLVELRKFKGLFSKFYVYIS